MKTAIYLNESDTQMVLSPENEWEKNILKMLHSSYPEPHTYWGTFYDCQGGWIRQYRGFGSVSDSEESSLIFRVNKQAERLPVETLNG